MMRALLFVLLILAPRAAFAQSPGCVIDEHDRIVCSSASAITIPIKVGETPSPISKEPIRIRDATGNVLPADQVLEIHVVRVIDGQSNTQTITKTVAQFEAELALVETYINTYGRSLRDPEFRSLLFYSPQAKIVLDQQKQLILNSLTSIDPGFSRLVQSLSEIQSESDRRINELKTTALHTIRGMVADKADVLDLPELTLPTLRELPTAEKPTYAAQKRLNWAASYGNANNFMASLNAFVDFQGSYQAGQKLSEGQAYAALSLGAFSSPLFIVMSGLATYSAPLEGTSSARINLEVLGRVFPIAEWQGPSLARGKSQNFEQGLDYSWSTRFMIGPIPCIARIGAYGSVGVTLGASIAPLYAAGWLTPFASTNAYAEVGADVGIAGLGVRGTLLLVRFDAPLQAKAVIALTVPDAPELAIEITGDSQFNFLAGSLGAYAYVWNPFRCSGGLFDLTCGENEEFYHSIYADQGFTQGKKRIMDYKMVISSYPGRSSVTGASVSAADRNQVKAEADKARLYTETQRQQTIDALNNQLQTDWYNFASQLRNDLRDHEQDLSSAQMQIGAMNTDMLSRIEALFQSL